MEDAEMGRRRVTVSRQGLCEVYADGNGYERPGYGVSYLEIPGHEAEFALRCVERWAMVAGMPDGEDSAGRAKLRVMTVDELAERACDVAEVTFSMLRARGMMVTLPSQGELEGFLRDAEDTN